MGFSTLRSKWLPGITRELGGVANSLPCKTKKHTPVGATKAKKLCETGKGKMSALRHLGKLEHIKPHGGGLFASPMIPQILRPREFCDSSRPT